jgi:hypothetical protein
VNPTALREALDAATHFKQQEMNDAMELLDTLYECFKKAQGVSVEGVSAGSRGVLVDGVFGLCVREQVKCRCGCVAVAWLLVVLASLLLPVVIIVVSNRGGAVLLVWRCACMVRPVYPVREASVCGACCTCVALAPLWMVFLRS